MSDSPTERIVMAARTCARARLTSWIALGVACASIAVVVWTLHALAVLSSRVELTEKFLMVGGE